MYLLKDELNLSAKIEASLKEICLFFVLVYVRFWFEAPATSDAGVNDLEFYNTMCLYKSFNEQIADAALTKFGRHLWYLSGELVGLSLFSDKNTVEEKRKMQKAIQDTNECWNIRRIKLNSCDELQNKSLSDLVDSTTISALKMLLGKIYS
jgi:hypothetical protein